MAPQLGRIFLDEIGAQQIAAFAQACLPQFVAIEAIAERLKVAFSAAISIVTKRQAVRD